MCACTCRKLIEQLWKDNYRCAIAGVMLSDFYQHGIQQQELFTAQDCIKGNSALMSILDQINEQHPNSLYLASTGTSQNWSVVRNVISSLYSGSLKRVW
ncbi:DUF4113 domain-containing protein [Rheinheimera sp. MM224]|uniref:DUF4113 domain-containing protein n=1 Tax=Rheinheimera sp. MM224 TaxID=3019969 RepID=UPI0021F8E7D6|nr:DUF4113 domain-containing protein [Rheinheimera sp. MM224]